MRWCLVPDEEPNSLLVPRAVSPPHPIQKLSDPRLWLRPLHMLAGAWVGTWAISPRGKRTSAPCLLYTLPLNNATSAVTISYRIQVLKQQDVFASLLQSIPLIVGFWMYDLKEP